MARARSRTPRRRAALLGGLLLVGACGLAGVPCVSGYLEAFLPEWRYEMLDLSAAKEEFLATPWGADYGYEGLLDRIRANDTPHMANSVYLDWTGA